MADEKKSGNDDVLARLIAWYDDSLDSTQEARAKAERDRDYYDNKQLTDAEVSALNERGQPPVIINRIKAKVDTMLGLETQTRTDPKAYPRNPQDEQGAHAATDAIRFVCDKARFPALRSEVFKEIIVEGTGAAIVEVASRAGRMEITPRRIPWDRLVFDNMSVERNCADAKFKGIVAWLDLDNAKSLYPKADIESLYESSVETESDTHADKPRHKIWTDAKRKRIRLVEMYYRESGKWLHCVFNKSGFAVEPQDSPYKDEDGEPTCPIEIQSCHIDRDNNRYGIVRQLIGPQDEINKRRSKALHLVSARQFVYEAGAVDNVQNAKKELAKPDGGVKVNPGMRFELLDHNDMAQANLGLLQEAKQEIDSVGVNAALQGKDKGSTSGRQDEIKQQNAITEIAAVMDARQQFQQAIYRQVWARIKQFWTAETWVRVTDDERNVRFVGLNTPAIDQMTGLPIVGPDGQPQIDNNTAQLDMDISLEDAPDTATLQAEQFEQLVMALGPRAPEFLDLIIEASSLRNKDKLLERIQGGGQQGGPPPEMVQHQQGMMAAEQEGALADVEARKAKAAQEAAKAEQQAAKIDQIVAQTEKILIQAENERTDPLRQMLARQMQAREKAQASPADAA